MGLQPETLKEVMMGEIKVFEASNQLNQKCESKLFTVLRHLKHHPLATPAGQNSV